MSTHAAPRAGLLERRVIVSVFLAVVAFHGWAATVGWGSLNLPGGEFRQAQTALSAHFIQRDRDFSLAYPTPVLGKPWSVPMEFPLYQWTVVALADATGLPLTQAGRTVSLACFYLTLPALFLLLGHLGVPPVRRLLPLALVLTCPIYILYSRSFLIETMALMLSVWFLLAFIEAVEGKGWWWLALANLAGVGAGLVKVTTFMLYLLPAGAWAAWILLRARPSRAEPGFRPIARLAGWIAGGTALPFAATLLWLGFADATKALNPSARFLLSENLTSFNFGTAETRFSGAIWAELWSRLATNLAWPPVLAVGMALVLAFGRRWWGQVAVCLATFAGAHLLFPRLYAYHAYYAVASGVLLMAALGFGLVGALDSRLPRRVVLALAAALVGGQVWLQLSVHHPSQRPFSEGGSGITRFAAHHTGPDDVLVMTGDDWNSMVPYYAQRRALMVRNGMERDEPSLTAALDALAGERIGLLVTDPALGDDSLLLRLAAARFDLDPRPLVTWRGHRVYLPREARARALETRKTVDFADVEWAPGVEPPANLIAGRWVEFSSLAGYERKIFARMEPRPARFFSSFGPGLDERDGLSLFGAHPETRLRFRPEPGRRRLRTDIGLRAATWDGSQAGTTDGIEFSVTAHAESGARRVLLTRLVDPVRVPADRGTVEIDLAFELGRGEELEIFIGSGPAGQDGFDWAVLGPVRID